jgi:hypothetical protein
MLALLWAATPAAADSPTPPRALTASERVDGKRVDAYPALWWQWANRKRWGAQPFQDPSGAQCARGQRGAVWFLAGTDGTEEVHRRCRVPSGKHLFLPVIGMLENAVPGVPRSCDEVKREATSKNAHAFATEILVDGHRFELAPLRMASAECFNAYARADYLDDTSGYFPSAADGYWLMLAPLPDGHHVIRVNVRYDNPGVPYGDMEQVFDYELDVGGPEPRDADDDETRWRDA